MLAHLLAAWVVRHEVCGFCNFAFLFEKKPIFSGFFRFSGLFPAVDKRSMLFTLVVYRVVTKYCLEEEAKTSNLSIPCWSELARTNKTMETLDWVFLASSEKRYLSTTLYTTEDSLSQLIILL